MITLTALNNVRCSIRPELIVAVQAGASTVVMLSTGVTLAVKESVDDVRRLMDAGAPVTAGATRRGGA